MYLNIDVGKNRNETQNNKQNLFNNRVKKNLLRVDKFIWVGNFTSFKTNFNLT